ncbi:TRAP transporter large permease [Undibacterium arcticum]
MTHGGVAKRMIKFATTMVGHWHGGIGLAGVIGCALFASVCGSSVATVAAIGSVVLPEMVKQGFPRKFGAGVIATSGALGILMLPSVIKVIYAVSTNTSIGALFIAGLIPGIILTAMLCLTTWNIARKNNYPRLPKASWRERWDAFRDCAWGLFLVVIVIGGIFQRHIYRNGSCCHECGVRLPGIHFFVYKDMTMKGVPKVLLDSAAMSAMLLYIITNATLFSFLMTSENVPQALTEIILHMGLGTVGFLLVVNVLLLVAGNVMEPSSIIFDHGADSHPGCR